MRKLTFIYLFLLSFVSFSQNLGNPAVIGQSSRNQKVGKGFQIEDTLLAKGKVRFSDIATASAKDSIVFMLDASGYGAWVGKSTFLTAIAKDNLGVSYGSDSIRLYIKGSTDTIVFGYAVRGLAYASDTLSWYEGGTRYAEYIGGGGGGASLSGLTAATSTNNIQNDNFKQRWSWNTLAGDTAIVIASNSTGAASNLQNLLTISQSGANATSSQTTYGLKVSNLKTGTTSTNIGAYFEALNGATNYAVDVLGDLRMNANSNIRMSSGAQIFQTSGSGINFNSTTHGIRYNGTGFMEYYGASTPHIFTTSDVRSFVIGATTSTNYFTIAKPTSTSNSIVFNGDFNASSYRGETTFSNVINSASGILKFSANTGQSGGFAAFTPNYVLTIKPTTCINLTPITATAASAITAAEGDLLFVSDTNGTFTSIGLWCYENGAWSKK